MKKIVSKSDSFLNRYNPVKSMLWAIFLYDFFYFFSRSISKIYIYIYIYQREKKLFFTSKKPTLSQ